MSEYRLDFMCDASPAAVFETAAWEPEVRALYDYWRAIHPAGGGLPGRQHFDPIDIPALMPWVWMLDIVRDGDAVRFRYRLLGTKHVEAMKRDMTGRWLDEAHESFLTHPSYHHYLELAGGRPSWRKGRPGFHVDPDLVQLERVMLPMARDGRIADMALALTVYKRRDGSRKR